MVADAMSMTLQQAIEKTIKTNPQILQATQNREAVEFELRQARGLYLPSVDLEAGSGQRRLSNNSSGSLRNDHDHLSPNQVGLTVTQTLFDGGNRRAQVDQQASRVDSASFRVLERSESLALQAVQDYLEYLLQAQIVATTKQNVAFHNTMIGNIDQSIKGGALTDADRLQGVERLQAAKARLREALEELEATKIRFAETVGEPISNPQMPPSVAKFLPRTAEDAVLVALANSPRISSANADINAADAGVRAARSNYLPTIDLLGTARVGDDIDGDSGNTNDFEVGVVARWNLYRGGIDVAREQEQIRRASEQRYARSQAQREVREAIRSAWNERVSRHDLAGILAAQSQTNERLVSSYSEQFSVGQRSLLDVLDAQNTRLNTRILADTARFAALFAEYKILAASGSLLQAMKLKPVEQAAAYARQEFAVPASVEDPGYIRRESHQSVGMPLDLLEPIRK